MTTDPRQDPRIRHGLIPLMAVLRKKRFVEEQRRRQAGAEPTDDQKPPRPGRKRGWLW